MGLKNVKQSFFFCFKKGFCCEICGNYVNDRRHGLHRALIVLISFGPSLIFKLFLSKNNNNNNNNTEKDLHLQSKMARLVQIVVQTKQLERRAM